MKKYLGMYIINPNYTEEQVDAVIEEINNDKKKLKVMPNGIKESIKTMAASKIMSGELDSLNRIKAIDEVLGTELMSMIS